MANTINAAMATLLLALVLGAAVWMAATQLSPVGAIYRSLSPEQKRHLGVLASSLITLLFGARLALQFAKTWLTKRPAS